MSVGRAPRSAAQNFVLGLRSPLQPPRFACAGLAAMDRAVAVGHGSAFGEWALGEVAEGADAVIHDDGTGHGDVHAEARRDLDDVVAARHERRRERALLGAQYVGGPQGMTEARQIDRVLEQLYADQPAAFRQHHVVEAGPVVVRQVPATLGGVGAGFQRLVGRTQGEREGRPEAVRGAKQVAEVQGLGDTFGAHGEVAAWQGGEIGIAHGQARSLRPGCLAQRQRRRTLKNAAGAVAGYLQLCFLNR